jgi:rhodanese-related sulfurtransferase
VIVGVAGLAFAFVANQLSPRGLNPGRNYHPGGEKADPAPQTAKAPSVSLTATNSRPPAASPEAALKERLEKNGLHLLQRDEVEKLFHDARRQQDLLMFIDARDEDEYHQGHIPGAYEFYHYYPDKYLADRGVPAAKLFIYGGGMTNWEAGRLPVESGARDSGSIRNPAP